MEPPRDSTQTTSAQHMTSQPCHTVLYGCQSQQGSALMRLCREKWVNMKKKHKTWGMRLKQRYTGNKWEDNSTEAAIAYWSVVNLSCEFIVLYECVLWLFLPDDEILLPADQVTYKVICGDLTSTYVPSLHPLCRHSYILADFLSSNNL